MRVSRTGTDAPPSPEPTPCASPRRPGSTPACRPPCSRRRRCTTSPAPSAPRAPSSCPTRSPPSSPACASAPTPSTPMCAFIPKYHWLTFFRLVHLRIPLPLRVLRRGRRVDDARVHDRPPPQAMARVRQVRVDRLEQSLAETVRLHKVPELQDRRLVLQPARQPEPANRRTDSTS